ncbi:SusC/RagA family TonB-linked outer membrane protein [Chitinophaga rhizosphaerae]|uniref:SusC/RagA family TonB-linked outer membrane protein n=1 Tax=Chitinophaga rhizosphaerae TaxID=1864947 RepID=UPI000F7FC847|nr:SusC/RagA family TonB-linked outer membrane protein [Chitinophaga rhizosphaerae]
MRKFHVRKLLLLPGAGFLAAGLWAFPASAVPNSPGTSSGTSARWAAIKGAVIDDFGKPVAGVLVRRKSGAGNAVTDADGNFSLSADPGETLVFSHPAFRTAEATASAGGDFRVRMLPSLQESDSLYHILYGLQRKGTSVAAIAQIGHHDLNRTFSTSLHGMMAGRLAGYNLSYVPGIPGDESFSPEMRGTSPMIMIDGAPARNMTNINPEQIESVTLLKDALSTAMYGMRASNGILLITTRKGEQTSGQRISFTAGVGTSQMLKSYKELSAYDYARLYNEAQANDGIPATYSQQDLDHYRNGTDPTGHPDVNWRNEVLKKNALMQRYDLNISGARGNARYFVDLNYTNQAGPFKTDAVNKYNTNADMQRYLVRSNVDVQINRSISASLNLSGRIQNNNEPGGFGPNIMQEIRNTPRNAYPVFNPDGSLGGNSNYEENIYALTMKSGYANRYAREVNAELNIRADLSDITPGMWFRVGGSYYTNYAEYIVRVKRNAVYQLYTDPATGETSYLKTGEDTDMGNTRESSNTERFFNTDAQLGWTRGFGQHHFNAMLGLNYDNRILGSQLAQYFLGGAARLQYDYAEKYMFEAVVGRNGTNRYHPDRRYGTFPAFGIGWNLAREDFLSTANWLNMLKLRATYGLTGDAFNSTRTSGSGESYFVYNQYYVGGTGYSFGTSHSAATGIREGTLNNPFISWEKARKFNIGLDVEALDNRIAFTADIYNDLYTDLLLTRGTATALLGIGYPQENLGKTRMKGMEFTATYRGTAGALSYYATGVLSMQHGINVYLDETARPYPWLVRTGNYTGMQYGYQADGLYQSEEEIERGTWIDGYRPKPGDIRYKDLNGDGRINQFDQSLITPEKPRVNYGLNLGFGWKGLDLSVLVQGTGNRYSNIAIYEFANNGKGNAFEHHLGRWTPETAASATYPRLTIGSNFNNSQASSYWIRNTSYLRLRNAELGYNVPERFARRFRLASARFFLNGTNLLTWSKFKDTDPENLNGNYPASRVMYAGINIKL